MIKNFTLSTSKKLAAYSAMAAALTALFSDANAQVVYNDIDDIDLSTTPEYAFEELDLDDNGITDFVFRAGNQASSTWRFISIFGLYSSISAGNVNNQIIGYTSGYPFASALDAGYVVDPGGNFLDNTASSNYGVLGSTFSGSTYGQFGDEGPKFIGIKFDIDGAVHYGWIRVSLELTAPTTLTIMDYAYNATPDGAINTGDTLAVAIDQFPENTFSVYSQQNTIYINTNVAMDAQTKIAVYNMKGQNVYTGEMTKPELQIQLQNAASGIYNVQIISENKMLNKKIFIGR